MKLPERGLDHFLSSKLRFSRRALHTANRRCFLGEKNNSWMKNKFCLWMWFENLKYKNKNDFFMLCSTDASCFKYERSKRKLPDYLACYLQKDLVWRRVQLAYLKLKSWHLLHKRLNMKWFGPCCMNNKYYFASHCFFYVIMWIRCLSKGLIPLC